MPMREVSVGLVSLGRETPRDFEYRDVVVVAAQYDGSWQVGEGGGEAGEAGPEPPKRHPGLLPR